MGKAIVRLGPSGLLAISLLAALASPASAQQAPSQYRSLSDVRPRIPDEHDRPYFRETQTHRGWEVREPQFTVFAATRPDDARWAAGHVVQAWKQAAALADYWTQVHHDPDFGLSALQVAINHEPLRDRYLPLTTLTGVSTRTHVTIDVAPGQPSLQQQVARLREGAAFAMLHAAGLDSAVPPWVVEGMAAVAARTGLTEEALRSNAVVDQAARFGGQQWRYQRATQDTLDYPRFDHEQAASQMAFLLKGDDAEHAPPLFAALRQATASAGRAAAVGKGFVPLPGDSHLPSATAVDQMIVGLRTEYAAWKENPRAGEPLFEPAADASPELVSAEREMLVLLKLQRRLASASVKSDDAAAGGFVTSVIDRGPLRTKVITFDRAKGAATNEPSKRAAVAMSFAAFAARLTDPTTPTWATLDVDGSLLLSTDIARVQSLLATNSPRYALENDGDRAILVRRLENGAVVRGWLKEDPQNKSRPLAKFEVVGRGGKVKVLSSRRADRQVTNLPH